jgi:predicted AlkP superfamily pyrophosphatase or phosphodiesterase
MENNYKLKGPFLSKEKGRLKNKAPLLAIRWSNSFSAEPSGINKHFKLHFYNHLLTSQQIIISGCSILLQKISNLTIDPYSHIQAGISGIRNYSYVSLEFIEVIFFILHFMFLGCTPYAVAQSILGTEINLTVWQRTVCFMWQANIELH